MDDWAVRPQRRLGIDDRGQFFEVPGDELGRVFRLVAGLRGDDRDGFADIPDLVMRKPRRRGGGLPRGAASSMSRMRPARSRWLIGFWIISMPGSSRP